MGWWSWFRADTPAGETPNPNPASTVGPPSHHAGDPRQVMLDPQAPPVINRGLPYLAPSSWAGYPAEWSTAFDSYGTRLGSLVDTAWAAIDLNASILSSMPLYRVKAGQALPPVTWMTSPAPALYVSWADFAKQLFWDYQMGEAFVLALARNAAGWPASITLVPPWMVQFEQNEYRIQGYDLDQPDLLHIRYARGGSGWRGFGPLEVSGARVAAATLIGRYQANYLEKPIPYLTIESDMPLIPAQLAAAKAEWAATRGGSSPADPAFLGSGNHLHAVPLPSMRDAMLVELSQWNESRIAQHCGVPPMILALPTGEDSRTYKNIQMLLDFHYRGFLRPRANAVMQALSNWALPYGQSVELNGDDYVRGDPLARAQAYQLLFSIGALSVDEIRAMERFGADDNADITQSDTTSAQALTGGDQ